MLLPAALAGRASEVRRRRPAAEPPAAAPPPLRPCCGAGAGAAASAMVPSGRTTIVFTRRGPPSGSSTVATAAAAPSATAPGHRRHGKFFLPRHDALGLRLIPILKTFVYKLVLVWKFLAASLLWRLLHGAAVGLDDGSLTSAHGRRRSAYRRRREHRRARWRRARRCRPCKCCGSSAELARWLGLRFARSHELAFVEEVGVALVAFIEILGAFCGGIWFGYWVRPSAICGGWS